MSLTANVQNGIPFTKLRKNPLQKKNKPTTTSETFKKKLSTQHDDTNVQRHYIVEHDLQK